MVEVIQKILAQIVNEESKLLTEKNIKFAKNAIMVNVNLVLINQTIIHIADVYDTLLKFFTLQ